MLSELTRNSRRFRSDRAKDRPRDTLRITDPGPLIVLRPALPKRSAGGTRKAAVLNNPVPPSTGRPVASARPLPTEPVPPESDTLPRTRAVNGLPLRAVTDVERFQSCSIRAPSE